jgi:hypothetical protein
MLHRDSLPIISIRGARAAIAPRIWRQLESVFLTHGQTCVIVALRRAPAPGCIKRPRTWFECPSCGALVGALAFAVFDADRAIGCRKCMPWRSREHRVGVKAPHVGPIVARAIS